MANYKLTYFDFDGGRGEPVRLAFHAAGIAFEDDRWTFPEFQENRASVRFSALPVLEIDGVAITQSNAHCRYVGRMAGLYPEDDLQALYCDEAMGAVEDLTNRIVPTFVLEGDELKTAREALVEGWLSTFVKGIGELLERGGEYFADNRLYGSLAHFRRAGTHSDRPGAKTGAQSCRAYGPNRSRTDRDCLLREQSLATRIQ